TKSAKSVEKTKKYDEFNFFQGKIEKKAINLDDEFKFLKIAKEKSLKEDGKTNDDLFYDPNLDSKDQKWVDNKRKF
uniref:Uncharacterized protein n=1 Tax=Romanomermis culicivorax TaxID=13658 RepID=A0A915JFQ6_ROMCU